MADHRFYTEYGTSSQSSVWAALPGIVQFWPNSSIAARRERYWQGDGMIEMQEIAVVRVYAALTPDLSLIGRKSFYRAI